MCAKHARNSVLVKPLIEHGCVGSECNSFGSTALHSAAGYFNVAFITALKAAVGETRFRSLCEVRDDDGLFPLHSLIHGTRKPENQDRRNIVERSKRGPEKSLREIGEGTPIGLAYFFDRTDLG